MNNMGKLPWKPRKGDGYWWVDFDSSAIEDHWDGCSGDIALYYAGNCFETREEALKTPIGGRRRVEQCNINA